MSKTVPPELRALEVFRLNEPVTPSAIDAHVGNGKYASKWVLYLKHRGFGFTVQKSGKTVVSYTLVSEPANAAELRAYKPKVTQPKVKAPKKNTLLIKKAAARKVKNSAPKRPRDEVTETFGTSGAETSYSVDADWDSMDGINLKDIL